MRVISFAIALCCLLVSTYGALVIPLPRLPPTSLTPRVRSTRLPKWFRDELKANEHLNLRNLTFMDLIDEAIRAKVEKCVPNALDREFLNDPNKTEGEKKAKWQLIYKANNQSKVWNDIPNRQFGCDYKEDLDKLFAAQKKNIAGALDLVVKIYTDFGSVKLNQNLHKGKAQEQLALALLLHDALKYRLMGKYNHTGVVYRGTLCNVKNANETLGQEFELDYFGSFSQNFKIAKDFAQKLQKKGDFEPCIITMNLQKDDHCGIDLRDYSHLAREREVLVPFSSKVKFLEVTANATEEHPYHNVTWGCSEKEFDDEANSTGPSKRASSLFYYE